MTDSERDTKPPDEEATDALLGDLVEQALAPFQTWLSAEALEALRHEVRLFAEAHPTPQAFWARLRRAPVVEQSGVVGKTGTSPQRVAARGRKSP